MARRSPPRRLSPVFGGHLEQTAHARPETRGPDIAEQEAGVGAWMILALLSMAIGAGVAKVVKGAMSIVFAAIAAWLGLLAWLLFSEYVLPYQGGGASMWPIAQMFGGTFVAIVAGGTAGLIVLLRPKPTQLDSSDSG